MILVNSCAPDKGSLGSVNGFAQMVATSMRTVGPAVASYVSLVTFQHLHTPQPNGTPYLSRQLYFRVLRARWAYWAPRNLALPRCDWHRRVDYKLSSSRTPTKSPGAKFLGMPSSVLHKTHVKFKKWHHTIVIRVHYRYLHSDWQTLSFRPLVKFTTHPNFSTSYL